MPNKSSKNKASATALVVERLPSILLRCFEVLPVQAIKTEQEAYEIVRLGRFNTVNGSGLTIELVVYEAGSIHPPHRHEHSEVLIYIISGDGVALMGESEDRYHAGSMFRVHHGLRHGFKAETDTLFLSINSPGIVDEDGNVDFEYVC
jgi:quercetin dioxygenase-like cupin family protein